MLLKGPETRLGSTDNLGGGHNGAVSWRRSLDDSGSLATTMLAMSWRRRIASLTLACLALACGGRSSLTVGEPLERNESTEPAAHPCIRVEPDSQSLKRVTAKVAPVRADTLFLLDNSSSMGEEIEQIASQLRERLVPAFRARTR